VSSETENATAAVRPLLRPWEAKETAAGVDGKLPFDTENDSLGDSPGERSVSYIVLAILSVALVRLAIVCVYPRRTIFADDPDANSVE
jgi:hypothetical protein